MKNVQNDKKVKINFSPFYNSSFVVNIIIIIVSFFLLYISFNFQTVPPILNRGIQPATFPKILLTLIIFLSSVLFILSLKKPWKKNSELKFPFYLTIISFIMFAVFSKIDFFLGIFLLSFFVSYFWGERKISYLFLVAVIFPIIVFIFFEVILGLRFPQGIITNLYYN